MPRGVLAILFVACLATMVAADWRDYHPPAAGHQDRAADMGSGGGSSAPHGAHSDATTDAEGPSEAPPSDSPSDAPIATEAPPTDGSFAENSTEASSAAGSLGDNSTSGGSSEAPGTEVPIATASPVDNSTDEDSSGAPGVGAIGGSSSGNPSTVDGSSDALIATEAATTDGSSTGNTVAPAGGSAVDNSTAEGSSEAPAIDGSSTGGSLEGNATVGGSSEAPETEMPSAASSSVDSSMGGASDIPIATETTPTDGSPSSNSTAASAEGLVDAPATESPDATGAATANGNGSLDESPDATMSPATEALMGYAPKPGEGYHNNSDDDGMHGRQKRADDASQPVDGASVVTSEAGASEAANTTSSSGADLEATQAPIADEAPLGGMQLQNRSHSRGNHSHHHFSHSHCDGNCTTSQPLPQSEGDQEMPSEAATTTTTAVPTTPDPTTPAPSTPAPTTPAPTTPAPTTPAPTTPSPTTPAPTTEEATTTSTSTTTTTPTPPLLTTATPTTAEPSPTVIEQRLKRYCRHTGSKHALHHPWVFGQSITVSEFLIMCTGLSKSPRFLSSLSARQTASLSARSCSVLTASDVEKLEHVDNLSTACIASLPGASWRGVEPSSAAKLLSTRSGRVAFAAAKNVSGLTPQAVREIERQGVCLSKVQCVSLPYGKNIKSCSGVAEEGGRGAAAKEENGVSQRSLSHRSTPAMPHEEQTHAAALRRHRGERGGGASPMTSPGSGSTFSPMLPLLAAVVAGGVLYTWSGVRRRSARLV